jgi:hypothetical protein
MDGAGPSLVSRVVTDGAVPSLVSPAVMDGAGPSGAPAPSLVSPAGGVAP